MPAAAAPTRLFTVRRVVSSVLLATAFGGLVVAFIMHDDTPTSPLRPRAIVAVSPEEGSLQLRQVEIYAQLDPTYTARLSVNGTVIPDDQLDVIEGLNRYAYTPGEGKEIDELPPGRTCAVVTYDLAVAENDEPASYRWCFNAS